MPQNLFWNLLAKKMAGEATTEEIQELEDLMRVHPECHYAAQHIQDIWGLPLKENQQAAQDAYLRHLNRMKKIGNAPADTQDEEEIDLLTNSPNRNIRKFVAFTSLGIAVLALVLFLVWPAKPVEIAGQKTSEVSTRMGSRSRLVLPDSSIVWLNAGSKLVYHRDFGTVSREVNLVGEAYFDVTHMPDLPFIIQTPFMQVKVLGTTFNVKSYPDESTSETSVIKGRVEVIPTQRPEEKFVLKPNEKLVLANVETSEKEPDQRRVTPMMIVRRPLTYTHNDSTVVETSWVENKLVFDDESFAEVALKMERWYAVKIIFTDRKIEAMHLTGSFVNENMEQALKALQLSSNFHYHVNQNIITITR
jgi:transmembrane sensor